MWYHANIIVLRVVDDDTYIMYDAWSRTPTQSPKDVICRLRAGSRAPGGLVYKSISMITLSRLSLSLSLPLTLALLALQHTYSRYTEEIHYPFAVCFSFRTHHAVV